MADARQLSRVSWDDLRIVLAVAEAGSLRSAAERVGFALNTVRAAVDRTEHVLAERLFDRSVSGVVPTAFGDRVTHAAAAMRSAFIQDMTA